MASSPRRWPFSPAPAGKRYRTVPHHGPSSKGRGWAPKQRVMKRMRRRRLGARTLDAGKGGRMGTNSAVDGCCLAWLRDYCCLAPVVEGRDVSDMYGTRVNETPSIRIVEASSSLLYCKSQGPSSDSSSTGRIQTTHCHAMENNATSKKAKNYSLDQIRNMSQYASCGGVSKMHDVICCTAQC